MKQTKRTTTLLAGIVALALLGACGKQEAEDAAKKAEQVAAEAKAKVEAEAKAMALAAEAYVYGYPLVTMEYTRRIMTNVEKPEGNRGPMGQFVRARTY